MTANGLEHRGQSVWARTGNKIDTPGRTPHPSRLKGKGKGLDTCYSATYMSQTRDQQRFTISEVAADWHEPILKVGIDVIGSPLPQEKYGIPYHPRFFNYMQNILF